MTTEEIVNKCKSLGITPAKLSQLSGVHISSTSRMFKGLFSPSLKNYAKYIDAIKKAEIEVQ